MCCVKSDKDGRVWTCVGRRISSFTPRLCFSGGVWQLLRFRCTVTNRISFINNIVFSVLAALLKPVKYWLQIKFSKCLQKLVLVPLLWNFVGNGKLMEAKHRKHFYFLFLHHTSQVRRSGKSRRKAFAR